MVDLDLVIVNYKTYDLIEKFIESFNEFKPAVSTRLLLIDNESDSDKLYKLPVSDNVHFFPFKENLGYSGACNFAASLSDSKYLGFLNSDTRLINNTCIDKCIEFLEFDDVAVVGPLQYSSEGKITHGGILGTGSKPKHRGWLSTNLDSVRDVQEAVTVSGSAYFTKRSVWNEMAECKIYKEKFPDAKGAWPPFPHFFEETLYSYHVRAHGYKCVYNGYAEMIHEWHKSSNIGSQDENFKYGQKLFREFCDDHGIEHD